MSCKKYQIKNTSNILVTFNYQRCDDYMWMYQAQLLPGNTKTIWSFRDSFGIADAFLSKVTISLLGDFHSTPLTSTITPTPTLTSTITPTPTLTSTITPTPTLTSTITPTQTLTPTNTPTITPTQPLACDLQAIDI